MGTDHSQPQTQLGEYLALLSQRDATGRPFIIVGGQAANFWAALYLAREPRLQQHFPLTNKGFGLDRNRAGSRQDSGSHSMAHETAAGGRRTSTGCFEF